MSKPSSQSAAILPTRRRESEIRAMGHSRVAGVDEAGVGPLAGPVIAAAVILPADLELPGVRDSKLIDEAERCELERRIQATCLAYGLGAASVEEIDRLGIYFCGALAMRRAVEALSV